MSSSIDKLAKDLYTIIDKKQAQKPSGYTTTATVSKIDDQTMWVRFPGNDFDTPVSNTVEAAPGDTVQVQVSNGRALATGNASAPSTDNTRANQAYDVGTEAGTIANIAIDEANRARNAADLAYNYAEVARGEAVRAGTEADNAKKEALRAGTEADNAKKEAITANTYANTALANLSVVEDVVDVLQWIQDNGRYIHTEDTSINAQKAYYTVSNETYVLTTDTSVNADKDYYIYNEEEERYDWVSNPSSSSIATYYELVGGVYTLVSIPTIADISRYYNIIVSDTVRNYILSHLSLTSSGMYLQTDNVNSKILLSNGVYSLTTDTEINNSKTYYVYDSANKSYKKVDSPEASALSTYYEERVAPGLSLYGSTGNVVGQFGENAQIGSSKGYNIRITSGTNEGRLAFRYAETEVAYLSNNMLYIPRAVVVNSMQVGDSATGRAWSWVIKDASSSRAGNLSLKWMG